MEGNKRTLSLALIAVAVGGLYFIITQLMDDDAPPESGAQTQAEGQASEDGASDDPESGDEGDTDPGQHLSDEEREALRETVTITTEQFTAEIDNLSGGIRSFRLHGERYHTPEGAEIDLVSTSRDEYRALRVDLARVGIPEDAVWELEQVSDTSVRLVWEGRGLRVTRQLTAGRGPYQIWANTRIENLASYARGTRLELSTHHYVRREDESGGIIASRSPHISHGVCVYGEDTERVDREDLVELSPPGFGYGANNVHLAAVESVYFAHAMAAHGAPAARCGLDGMDFPDPNDPGEAHGTLFHARLIYPWVTIEPGADVSYQTLAYLGPKEPAALNAASHRLPELVDLGFFSLIARQLARLLSFLHQHIPGQNWGLAIILLTLMIRLTLFPLTNLSFKSMARMRQLKPEIDRINELYKDDAEKKGAAVMELYRKHKINPLSGCLPSLVQLPVWWALYTSLSTNIELYHMPFALWWTDLSSPDPYYVLPVMLGALMHLQQRLSPTTMDPTQAKMMMYFMPIMITVFMLFLPSGLCLYMLTNSALGIAQQKFNEYRINKATQEAAPPDDDDEEDPETDLDDGSDDTPDRPQRRRPRRKRRVRRGRA